MSPIRWLLVIAAVALLAACSNSPPVNPSPLAGTSTSNQRMETRLDERARQDHAATEAGRAELLRRQRDSNVPLPANTGVHGGTIVPPWVLNPPPPRTTTVPPTWHQPSAAQGAAAAAAAARAAARR